MESAHELKIALRLLDIAMHHASSEDEKCSYFHLSKRLRSGMDLATDPSARHLLSSAVEDTFKFATHADDSIEASDFREFLNDL